MFSLKEEKNLLLALLFDLTSYDITYLNINNIFDSLYIFYIFYIFDLFNYFDIFDQVFTLDILPSLMYAHAVNLF